MFRSPSMFTGLAIGAGLAYFFDGKQGNRRRQVLADQFNRMAHQCVRDFDASFRDLSNRTKGTVAETRALFSGDGVPDELVVQRVRSMLGHYASNAHAIEVGASNGHIVLRGPIPRVELPALLAAVATVRGVRTVTDELVMQTGEDNDGANQETSALSKLMNQDLAPGTRLLVGSTGAVLLANCMISRQRSLSTLLLGFAGFGMLARSLANSAAARSWQQVSFHKTVIVRAPIEKVFGFLTKPSNWPAVSPHIRNLQYHSENTFSKDYVIPGGINLHCSEEIDCLKENECFMTHSLPDSMLSYEKQIHFERAGDHTRIHLHFRHNPPGGLIGHCVASLLGFDAKSFFDDFLMRAKTFLETGLQPHDVAKQAFNRGGKGGDQQAAESAGRATDAGANVPPHEHAPQMGDVAEVDPFASSPLDVSNVEQQQAAMRNHI